MNKSEFLNTLAASLNGFSGEEIDRVIGYYDELISDKIETGQNEERVIAEFGEIKNISRQISAELAGERLASNRFVHLNLPFFRKKTEQTEKQNISRFSRQGAIISQSVNQDGNHNLQSNQSVVTMQPAPQNTVGSINEQCDGYINNINQVNQNTGLQQNIGQNTHGFGHNNMQETEQFHQNNDYGNQNNKGQYFRNSEYAFRQNLGQNNQKARYNGQDPQQNNNGNQYYDYNGHCNNNRYGQTKKSGFSTFIIVARLFTAPALLPLGIVFFALWFALAVTVLSLTVAFGASAIACGAGIAIGIAVGAAQGGAALALLLSAAMMICTGMFGLLTVITAKCGGFVLKNMLKAATSFIRVVYGGRT